MNTTALSAATASRQLPLRYT